MKQKDNIYGIRQKEIKKFKFDKKVAEVFDDMIERSVPLYFEIIDKEAKIAARFYKKDTYIYDLGCSTGNFCSAFSEIFYNKTFKMVCVDNSEPMLEICKNRIKYTDNIKFICEDILKIGFEKSSVVIANFIFQFLPVSMRDNVIKKIYNSLIPGGILLTAEKIDYKEEEISALYQDFYYKLKEENGYSGLEISQKREALENVLLPETITNHMRRFFEAGFKKTDIWLKWFNFTAFICIK
ncbi:MAG: carboxy-S-adenosyl-L-methionine synthase CmoA [Deltaproteobacteria bacterium]|nr:carboxy-S-adenosyl-L-methionine synthase CmoA [Deltaproteobacteria bacterium]